MTMESIEKRVQGGDDRMTKTKRQLRAEAAERLRECRDTGRYIDGLEVCSILIGTTREKASKTANKAITAAIIDLLTDDEPTNGTDGETNVIDADAPLADEPPERDPVRIMRECAASDVPVVRLCEKFDAEPLSPSEHARVLNSLADMVERYYVLRIFFNAVCAERGELLAENAVDARTINRLAAERDKLLEECDEFERIVDGLTAERDEAREIRNEALRDAATFKQALGDAAILKHERDEWKAKAEHDGVERSNNGTTRGMTNLEWLYENDEQFAAYVRISEAVIKRLAPSYAHEWLVAEHMDADGTADGTCPDGGRTCPDGNGTETAESVRQADLPDMDCGHGADMTRFKQKSAPS